LLTMRIQICFFDRVRLSNIEVQYTQSGTDEILNLAGILGA
jgi:hypothetical protein